MKKRWVVLEPNPDLVDRLCKELNLSLVVSRLLVNRGIDDVSEARLFLNGELKDLPSPYLLKDMKKAVVRLVRAIQNRESIYVYGDYDVDGQTATASLLNFFEETGIRANFHIPHRLKEGYGLHRKALEEIREKGGNVVITADCGISNVEEAYAASQLGIDLIITDHHIVPPKLPEAHAVLNPLRSDSDYPDTCLSGVGVVFQLLIALRAELRNIGYFQERKEPLLKNYLDLVALGTIADLVPLSGVNHILVREGLKALSLRRRVGIKSLAEVAGITKESIGTYEVGFQLAPRLNAGGRLSTAELGVRLLTSHDYSKTLSWARELDSENSKRRFIQEEILYQAVSQVEESRMMHQKTIVLSSPSWHPGVIGIVASKLVEKYYRPTFLIAEGEETGKGSGRSIEALHLLDAMRKISDLFQTFGGHKAAAGFSIQIGKIQELKNRFEEVVSELLSEEDLMPKVRIDAKIGLNEVTKDLIEEIEKLSPFGMGNREPVFLNDSFKVARSSLISRKHLKLFIEEKSDRLEAIGFNMPEYYQDSSKIQAILFTPTIHQWNHESTIQLRLKALSF